MTILGLLFVAFNFIIILVLFYNYYYKLKKLPPGPTPLPFIGNLLELHKNQPGEDCYIKWSKQFGDVYTFWAGEQPVIVVAGYKKIIEIFQKDSDAYTGRFNFEKMDKILRGNNLGVFLTEGSLWRDQRRFALHVFRNFGLGKNLMQERILHEIESRFEELNAEIGDGLDNYRITDLIDICVGSIINYVTFGYRFDREKTAEFYELKEFMSKWSASFAHPIMLVLSNHVDLLKNLPIFKDHLISTKTIYDKLFGFFRRQINEHMENIDFDDVDAEATDYVEAFLREKHKLDATGNTDHYYSIDQLVNMCFDIWFAGQESTSITIGRGLSHILHNLEIQDKIHNELNSVIGNTSQKIVMADRANLPYTSAVINEAQRITNLVPLNVLRRTTCDVVIDKFKIPKGTCIVPQISTILYDEKLYPEPKKFMPERFITEDGKLKRSDELIPFSLGKRQCLGEGLAKMELFLIFANFFNQYKILPDKTLPDLSRKAAIVVACPEFTCRIEKRQK